MVKLFLKIKNWQLFIIVWALPSLLIASSLISKGLDSFLKVILVFLGLLILVSGLMGWMYSIGVGLKKMLPEDTKMKLKLFRICTITIVVWAVILMVVSIGPYITKNTNLSELLKEDSNILIILHTIVMILIGLINYFSLFAIFYDFHFCSKTLKTIELQQKIKFGKYAGEFFLIWFSFIGIWFIQPRVNKIFKEML
jgi:hypothetical protein